MLAGLPGLAAAFTDSDHDGLSNHFERHRSHTDPHRKDSSTRTFHMDFGSYAGYGIPYQVVDGDTALGAVTFDYGGKSDAGPYPIPDAPPIEGGSDRHLLAVDRETCRPYEVHDVRQATGGAWRAGSGAQWDLASNALRPAGWTSADAAGLPILPGLVRYDEVAAGVIEHALRFTAPQTRKAYLYPARHFASSSTCASLPPMGLRVRLRATGADLEVVDTTGLVSGPAAIVSTTRTPSVTASDG